MPWPELRRLPFKPADLWYGNSAIKIIAAARVTERLWKERVWFGDWWWDKETVLMFAINLQLDLKVRYSVQTRGVISIRLDSFYNKASGVKVWMRFERSKLRTKILSFVVTLIELRRVFCILFLRESRSNYMFMWHLALPSICEKETDKFFNLHIASSAHYRKMSDGVTGCWCYVNFSFH